MNGFPPALFVTCTTRSVAGVANASRLPYYCTPPVIVPDVIGKLAVWRHNNKENEREDTEVIYRLSYPSGGHIPWAPCFLVVKET